MARTIRALPMLAFVAAVAAAAPSARAVPVEFGFLGIVTTEDGQFPAGALLSGSYLFDSVPTSVSTAPGLARYRPIYSVSGLVSVIPYEFIFTPVTPTSSFITVTDESAGEGTDGYQFQLAGGTGSFTLTVEDDDGAMLSDLGLPLAPPSLAFAERATFSLVREGDETLVGDITSLFVVPEPSAGWLLGFGVAASLARARRYDSRRPRLALLGRTPR